MSRQRNADVRSAILERFSTIKRESGLFVAVARALRHPVLVLAQRMKQVAYRNHVRMKRTNEERFTWIYKNNLWGCRESVSGWGSTLSYTENIRSQLPHAIRQLGIASLLDAPCGDYNWMREVVARTDVTYIGGDIVYPLIESLSARFSTDRTSFIQLDITRQNLPKADMMLCRDCLFHFSECDILRFLENFANSQIPYLLTTTHKNHEEFKNVDIETGGFRLLDLFSAPYLFSADPILRIDDWVPPEPPREVCVWSRDQVLASLQRMRDFRAARSRS